MIINRHHILNTMKRESKSYYKLPNERGVGLKVDLPANEDKVVEELIQEEIGLEN
jgi:hypothetical protein